jgi:O-antigen ligase
MKKIIYWVTLIIIAYIPFYRFSQALLESHTNLSPSLDFWLAHWYEPVLLFLIILSFFYWFFREKIKLSISGIIAPIILIFGYLSIIVISASMTRGLEGARFLLLPLTIFSIYSFVPIEKGPRRTLINTYLFIAVIAAFWSLIERVLPNNYLITWHILKSNENWYGYHTIVGLKQGVSFIGGPNLLAAYLLPAIFLASNKIRQSVKIFSTLYFIASTLMIVALFLTFSRSAIIGLIVTALIAGFVSLKTWRGKITLLLLAGVAVIIALIIYQSGNTAVKDLFTHGASQQSHLNSIQVSIDELKNRASIDPISFIFGKGLASAGPAAMKYGDGIISESWYLEVLLEMGVFGLLLWLIFFVYIIRDLWRAKETSLMYGVISILIMTAFLHTLSDNPALTMTLFALLVVSRKVRNI